MSARRVAVLSALSAQKSRFMEARSDILRLQQEEQEAEARLDEIRACIELTKKEMQNAASMVEDYQRDIFAIDASRLGDDVWQYIFDLVSNDAHGGPPGWRELAPFKLAAISRRFRSIALSTSSIWSTVFVDPTHFRGDATLVVKRVNLQLSRSASHLLDLHIDCITLQKSHHAAMNRVLDLLAEVMVRWHTANIRMPYEMDHRGQWSRCLLQRAPQLEHLQLSGLPRDLANYGGPAALLPCSSRLHTLRIANFSVRGTLRSGGAVEYRIATLKLASVKMASVDLCLTLRALVNLEQLSLWDIEVEADVDIAPLNIPKLWFLDVDSGSTEVLSRLTLHMPLVTHFVLNNVALELSEGQERFIRDVSRTVSILRLSDCNIGPTWINPLQYFQKLERLDFCCDDTQPEVITFIEANDTWPNLKEINTSWFGTSQSDEDVASFFALLQLVRSRNSHEQTSTGRSLRRITRITVHTGPQWMNDQLQLALRSPQEHA